MMYHTPIKYGKGSMRMLSLEIVMKALKAQGVFDPNYPNNPAVSIEIKDGEKIFIKFSNV
jgi:hypothetical protein